MKNIKKLTGILLGSLLLSSTAFSQTPVIIESDTNICFTIPQSKFLLKQVYLVAEKDTLLNLTEEELRVCAEKTRIYQEQIEAFKEILDKQIEITQNAYALNNQKDEQIKILKKEISKQKVKTWAAILGGVVSTAFISYLYFSK